ncbi:MAG: iron complex outermembrane receptor protein [Planctomycetota bacterium]
MRQQLILASRWLAISAATSATALAAASPAPQGPPEINPIGTEGLQDPKPKQQVPKKQQVVVTAQKQGAEAMQDVPRSVTAIDQKLIRDAGLTSIEDAARLVPNTLITGFSARRLSFPYVRGVGSGQGGPAVATFVDDVPQLSVSSTNLSFAGLERVEILRGPSSVLWGRNTIGGAINMISRKPSWEPGGEFQTSFGNYNSSRYQVRATGPVTDETLAMSVDASYEKRDGYTDNLTGGNDVGDAESTFARMQFLWAPNDDNTVHFSVYGEASRDGGFVLSNVSDQPGQPGLRSNPFRINQDFEGSTERDILAGSIVWNHYGNDFEFVSITSAQMWDIDESADFDFSQLDGVRRFTNEEEEYAYQELRLQSAADAGLDAGRKDGVKWLVGTSGFISNQKREATNEFRPGGAGIIFAPAQVGSDRSAGSFDSWSASVFGQATMMLRSGFEAAVAVRYDYESRDAEINRTFSGFGIGGSRGDRSFERILPRASIAYRCSEDFKSYFSVARGFKAGGFNLTAPTGSESFGTETSWTYELGAKTQWFDDRLTANAAIFLIDWDDMQLSQFDPTAGGFVSNAGKSTSQGVELELAGQISKGWTVFGTAGYLDTKFGRASDQNGSVRGNNLPFAPKMTFGAGTQYSHKLDNGHDIFARIDWFHVGEFSYDASGAATERYNLTNLRVGYTLKNVRLEGFVSNLLDEEYVGIAFDADPRPAVTSYVGQNGTPRTYGLSMSVTF